jgi:N6-adenosine-specific RNA methylase IME4
MWATIPFLPQACSLIKQWGFRYSTSRVWIKTWPKNAEPPWDRRSFTHGSGYEVLGNPELLMIGKIGKPKGIPPPRPRALIIAPRREHSRKPDEIRQEILDRLEGPYCELFARSAWPGFDAWGNETERFNDMLNVA